MCVCNISRFQFKMELPAWQTWTKLILIIFLFLLVWLLRNNGTITINLKEMTLETQIEGLNKTVEEKHTELNIQIQSQIEGLIKTIEEKHAELDIQIQSIKKEITETTKDRAGGRDGAFEKFIKSCQRLVS